MKLKYFILLLIFISLLSMNFIVAQDINETDLNNHLEIEDDNEPISISDDFNPEQDTLNQNIDDSKELISSEDNYNHVYVSPDGSGDGSSETTPADFKNTLKNINDNTIVHMLNGNYTWSSTGKNDVIKISSKNNIIIMAQHSGEVFINSTYNNRNPEYTLDGVNNVTFKNIIFHASPKAKMVFQIKSSSNNVLFENCSFINYKDTYSEILDFSGDSIVYVNNCSFINSSVSVGILVYDVVSFITNCTFENCFSNEYGIIQGNGYISGCNFINNNANLNYPVCTAGNVYSNFNFKNNIVDNKYLLKFTVSGGISSPTTLTVLNNTQLTATGGDVINITAVLVDDMGNYINIPKITFSIEGKEYDATYNNGVYSAEYTVPEVDSPEEIVFDSQITSEYLSNLTVNYQPVFLFVKPALKMNASDISDADYGDNITICVNISNMESGSLTYEFIKNNEVVKTLVDSFANNVSTVNINDLSAGDYTVNIKYLEDQNFGATTITKTFTVNKANATLQLNVNPEIPVFDNITVQAVISPTTAGGNVTFKIKGENQTITISGGVAEAIFAGLGEGNYTVFAIYNGDDNYNPSIEYNATFNVVKVNSTLDVEHTSIVPGENVDIIITLNKDINDNVTITVNNGEPVSEKLTNGTLTYTIENIALGDYNVTVNFKGNEKYFGNVASTLFTVERLESNLNVSAANVDWGNPVVVSVSTDERFSGDVEVSIGDRTEIAHVVNGSGEATFTNLAAETYTVTAKLNETDVFNADEKNTTVTVNKVASELSLSNDLVFDYGSSNATTVTFAGAVDITAVVLEDSNANVVVDGNVITVSGLNAGNYTLKVTTNPDENHTEVSATVNITVNKVNSFIDIRNEISYDYGGIGQCSVFTEGAVNFTARVVNHTEAIISISPNGIVNVSGLDVGKYVLEVTTNPDKNHLSVTSSVNVTVSKVDSQITIPNIVFDYGATGNATVTVVGATGINASVLNHTEAVVNIVNNTITVSGLAAGSYVLQATTIPDGNHNPVTATANITVNGVEVPADKAISTNVPANTKSPTFSIKLEKDATGTFTVNIDNGKIVKTVDLKDGAASITVADLAAGDHTISVSYSGDGKYAPITQNTTLTIKEPVKPTPKVTKKATKITAKKATFKAKKKTKKYTITLKAGKKAVSKVKVTIKVGKKTYTAKTNKKGKATFNLKKLTKKGKYTAVIKFKGNKNYKATSKKVKITVKK